MSDESNAQIFLLEEQIQKLNDKVKRLINNEQSLTKKMIVYVNRKGI